MLAQWLKFSTYENKVLVRSEKPSISGIKTFHDAAMILQKQSADSGQGNLSKLLWVSAFTWLFGFTATVREEKKTLS